MLTKPKCCIAVHDPQDLKIIYTASQIIHGEIDCGKVVNNSEAFLLSAGNDRSDIAIVDTELPGLDVFECIEQIRTQKPLHIILIVPERSFDYAYKAMKAHVCEIIVRPFETRDISDALQCAVNYLRAETTHTTPGRETSRSAFVTHLDALLDGRATPENINLSYNTRFRDGLFRVVSFTLDMPDINRIPEIIRQFWHSIRSFLEPKLLNYTYDMIHTLVYNEIRIALNYPSKSDDLVLKSLHEVFRSVEDICKCIHNAELYMGIGQAYTDINKLSVSSEESKAGVWTRMSSTKDPTKSTVLPTANSWQTIICRRLFSWKPGCAPAWKT